MKNVDTLVQRNELTTVSGDGVVQGLRCGSFLTDSSAGNTVPGVYSGEGFNTSHYALKRGDGSIYFSPFSNILIQSVGIVLPLNFMFYSHVVKMSFYVADEFHTAVDDGIQLLPDMHLIFPNYEVPLEIMIRWNDLGFKNRVRIGAKITEVNGGNVLISQVNMPDSINETPFKFGAFMKVIHN